MDLQAEFLALLPPGTTLSAPYVVTDENGHVAIDHSRVFVTRPMGLSVCVLVDLQTMLVIVQPRNTRYGPLPSENSRSRFDTLEACAGFVARLVSAYAM